MTKPVDYIRRLAATSSTTEKQAILREAATDGCTELFEGLRLCYNKRAVFNVKKVPLIEGEFTDEELAAPSDEFNWPDFVNLANKLETRQLTGNAARDALRAAAEVACVEDWNLFYRPILTKDMRCGVTDTTVNKVLKDFGKQAEHLMIPVWKVMLADDAKKHPNKMKGPKALDAKCDGMRLTAVVDIEKKKVQMFSRNGKENTNFTSIVELLEKMIPDLPISIVLDGEVISDNFQSLMTQANRKKDINTDDSRYALFDMVALEDFEAGGTQMGLMDRHQGLVELIDFYRETFGEKIFVLPKLLVDLDTDEGQQKMLEFYDQVIDESEQDEYLEGIMIKDADGPYECKRSRAWLKWKPEITVDLKIVDVEPGEVGKKREGLMGALVCEGTEDGKFIHVNVGSGFNDDQLKDFWDRRADLINEIAEIEADAITKADDGDYYSLRFPRFKRFRSIDHDGKI